MKRRYTRNNTRYTRTCVFARFPSDSTDPILYTQAYIHPRVYRCIIMFALSVCLSVCSPDTPICPFLLCRSLCLCVYKIDAIYVYNQSWDAVKDRCPSISLFPSVFLWGRTWTRNTSIQPRGPVFRISRKGWLVLQGCLGFGDRESPDGTVNRWFLVNDVRSRGERRPVTMSSGNVRNWISSVIGAAT